MSSDAWHYVKGSSSEGPVTTAEIEAMIARGTLTPGTLIWNESLPSWEPVEYHFEFAQGRRAPPVPGATAPRTMQHSAEIGYDGLYVGAPSRSFVEAIQVCFSKYATFRGRASRSEYWWFVLFNVLVGMATSVVDIAFVGMNSAFSPLNTLFSLAVLIPSLAVTVRRIHDLDRTGWWVGGFYLSILVFVVLMGAFGTLIGSSEEAAIGFGIAAMVGGLAVLVYSIVLLVFQCSKGTPGPNRYG